MLVLWDDNSRKGGSFHEKVPAILINPAKMGIFLDCLFRNPSDGMT